MNTLGISGLHNSIAFKRKEFPALSARQYRIAQGFDSAAAVVTDGVIRAAAAEERFTGEKGTGAFPIHAVRYCLRAAGLTADALDHIAHGFSYEPVRAFYEYHDFTKRQFAEVYSHEAQAGCLEQHLPSDNLAARLVGVPHHLAHAASTFYLSGFEDSLILVVDGMGELHSMTVAIGEDREMTVVNEVTAAHSLGILYGVCTMYLGFEMGLDEYKVMGLAPYGDPSRYFGEFANFIQLKRDGSYTIPLLAHDTTIEERETHEGVLRVLADTFGPPRNPESEITRRDRDVAAALQAALQACLLHVLRHYKRQTGQRNLCLAGGVALNCTANGVIRRSRLFQKMFVQPAAGDDGTALGAALYVHHLDQPGVRFGKMRMPFWGPGCEDEEIRALLTARSECCSGFYPSAEQLVSDVAQRLARGEIVGWFQGRMEFGPRALGNRSILADPRDRTMRERLNRLVKKREAFRPFAPVVTMGAASRFFDIDRGDESTYAHMLCVTQVREEYRARLPAITHVDGSARVQTVSRDDHPRLWMLLNEFEKLTGIPVLLNTSFNVRGQPIVCTPGEAIDTFLAAQLDVLVIGNHVVVRDENGQSPNVVDVGGVEPATSVLEQ